MFASPTTVAHLDNHFAAVGALLDHPTARREHLHTTRQAAIIQLGDLEFSPPPEPQIQRAPTTSDHSCDQGRHHYRVQDWLFRSGPPTGGKLKCSDEM